MGFSPNYDFVTTGTALTITPTITPDKKHVLLNIETNLRDAQLVTHTVQALLAQTGETEEYEMVLPDTEESRIMTRVSVPDGGTLLLGGLKIRKETEIEVGVPVLSKVPFIGRLFDNRSTVRDHSILLILVKPTIILQEEVDAEALAALEDEEGVF